MKQINKIITLSVLGSSVLLGATPNIGDIEKQVQPPKEVEKKQTPLVEIGGIKKYAAPMTDDKSGKTIFVKSFKLEGAVHIKEEKLLNLISSYTNKDLSFKELQEITSIITKEYREKGYFVARAYIPVQDISKNDNIFKIAVIEGNYGEFKLTNNSLVKDSIVQGMFDDAKNRSSVVSSDSLERAMLVINETPGAVVSKAEVKPGTQVGTSDFIVETQESKAYGGYVVADNYGSKYVGKNRVMAGVDLNSPFKIGDRLSFSGLISNGADLKNYKLAYNASLMSNGLRGEISYTNTNYNLVKLGDGILDEEYYGDSKTVEAKIIYPIIKSRLETLDFITTYVNKNISSTTNEKDTKNINSLSLGLNHIKNQIIFGLEGKTTLEGIFTAGELDDNNDMNGSYQKINLNTALDLNFNSIYSMSTSLKLQKAFKNKNLDGSEDMNIGGAYGVKVFPDAELSAEQAALFNVEFFAKLPEVSNLNHKVGLFYDLGIASMSDKTADTTFETRTLQDVGIGYYTNYKNAFTKLQVARVVGGQDIETENVGNISRVLVQAGFVF